jgi:hypothetical protein
MQQVDKRIQQVQFFFQVLHEQAHKNQFGLNGFPQYTHFLREY